jgi:hypothetical protein
MIFVKNKISSYNLYKVGIKYLGRNRKVFDQQLIDKKAFVVIFRTTGNKKEIKTNLQEHNDKTLELWKKGLIENAYLDIEGFSSGQSDIPAIVYFVNAKDEGEVQRILAELPFVKKGLAKYQTYPVGVFWLGQYEIKDKQ